MSELLRLYHPIGDWTGRLILPEPAQRRLDGGVWIEVHNAPSVNADLIGQTVPLSWSSDPDVQGWVQSVTHDVNFTRWTHLSQLKGNLHPERLDGWRRVSPLESLAGARREDDVTVWLRDVVVAPDRIGVRSLLIQSEPVQITGRTVALVTVLKQKPGSNEFWVQHFNKASQMFDGTVERVCFHQPMPDRNGVCRFTLAGLERSPLNPQGWYVYGEPAADGTFVVSALEPAALMQVQPDQKRLGMKAATAYIARDNWKDTPIRKGTAETVLVASDERLRQASTSWQEGDRAIVVHLYGGIGGRKAEPAPFGLVTGHFAYGLAQVVRDRFTDKLRLDIDYKQIYGHNPDGIISGTIKWSCYAGDLQRGWMGNRPISDVLVKLDTIAQNYDFGDVQIAPLDQFSRQLDAIAARYRTGHGTGVALVNLATSCVQDSNQALYLTIKKLQTFVRATPAIRTWLQQHPHHPQGQRFRRLAALGRVLERNLVPLGIARPDWRRNVVHLFKTRNFHNLLDMLLRACLTWRTMMPRRAHDEILHAFLKQGAVLWFIRTNQIGGDDPEIEPRSPRGILGWLGHRK